MRPCHCNCVSCMQKEVEDRREHVRKVVSLLTPTSDTTQSRFVSTAALQQWVNARPADLEPVDNSALLCSHNRLSPTSWQDCKRISAEAWHLIRGHCGGGPELALTDLCEHCSRRELQTLVKRYSSLPAPFCAGLNGWHTDHPPIFLKPMFCFIFVFCHHI